MELDESVPEIVYRCISIIDSNSCKKDETCVKCPLCKQFGKTYYCVECVKNGNFLHSKKRCYERFADKKVSRYKLDGEKSGILQKYEENFSKKKQIENLKLEIYKSEQKIGLLKASIKACRGTIANDQEVIEEIKKNNSECLSNQFKLNKTLFKIRRSQTEKNTVLEGNIKALRSTQCALEYVTEKRVKELIQHIFPIKVEMYHHSSSSSEHERFSELEEAQKTIYIEGQWVVAGNATDDVQYSVVKPCIPGSGDYSPYIDWCAEHVGISRAVLSAADKCQFDKAYGISAALAYTAQLVSILAFYLNVYVPKRSSFSDFCEPESSKTKFLHKVAKLNANIVSLCLSRRVDITKINSHRTIENLLLVLNGKRSPAVNTSNECMEELMLSIEESLSRDLLPIDESDSDEIEGEFVHVSEEDVALFCDHSLEQPISQSSLVSSVFSFFKAATI